MNSADITYLPRVRNVLHRPAARTPYRLTGGWRAVESADSLSTSSFSIYAPAQTATKSLDKPRLLSSVNELGWTLPVPPIRTKGNNSGPMKNLPLSTIPERSTTAAKHVADMKKDLQTANDKLILSNSLNSSPDSLWKIQMRHDAPFQRQQRSSSYEQLRSTENSTSGQCIVKYPLKPILKRSRSLQNGQSGLAPTDPLPLLPTIAVRWSRTQALRDVSRSPDRGSTVSSGSVSSSIMHDDGMHSLSTDITYRESTSAALLEQSGRGTNSAPGDRNFDRRPKLDSACTSTLSTSIQPKVDFHQPTTPGIGKSTLIRSASSGLSLSMLDKYGIKASPSYQVHSKQDVCDQDRNELGSMSTSGVLKPGSGSNRPKSTSSVRFLTDDYENRPSRHDFEDASKKRRSTSALQEISHNQGTSFNSSRKRPSSVATSEPFKWDSNKVIPPGRPSAMKGRVESHKRQSCRHIKFVVPLTSSSSLASRIQTLPEEDQVALNHISIPALNIRKSTDGKKEMLQPRPPSRSTFEPEFKVQPSTPESSPFRVDPYCSPTMSMFQLYQKPHVTSPSVGDASDLSQDPFTSSPAKRPMTIKPRARRHPNRHKTLVTAPRDLALFPPLPDVSPRGQGQTPSATLSTILAALSSPTPSTPSSQSPSVLLAPPSQPTTPITPKKAPEISSSVIDSAALPSPSIPVFPVPPLTIPTLPSWRLPTAPRTPINGPRAAPNTRPRFPGRGTPFTSGLQASSPCFSKRLNPLRNVERCSPATSDASGGGVSLADGHVGEISGRSGDGTDSKCPGTTLQTGVLELRRMNSEAISFSDAQRLRYFNLGMPHPMDSSSPSPSPCIRRNASQFSQDNLTNEDKQASISSSQMVTEHRDGKEGLEELHRAAMAMVDRKLGQSDSWSEASTAILSAVHGRASKSTMPTGVEWKLVGEQNRGWRRGDFEGQSGNLVRNGVDDEPTKDIGLLSVLPYWGIIGEGIDSERERGPKRSEVGEEMNVAKEKEKRKEWCPGTPGSIYDSQGFLKGLG